MSITAVLLCPPVTARDTASREVTIVRTDDTTEANKVFPVDVDDEEVTIPGLSKGGMYDAFFNDTDKAGNRSPNGAPLSFTANDNTAPPAPAAPALVSADEVEDTPPA